MKLFALALALLLMVEIKWMATYPLEFDAGYNSTIAKNIAGGYGYVSLYPSNFPYGQMTAVRPLPPEITTGPPAMAVAALFVKIFGNRYWVTGLAMVVLGLGLLAASWFWLWREPYWRPHAAFGFGLGLLLALPFLHDIRCCALVALFQFFGDVPASLFLLAGVVLAIGCGRGWAGFAMLAAAYLTKDLAILPVAVTAAVFGWQRWRAGLRALAPVLLLPAAALLKEAAFLLATGSWTRYLAAKQISGAYFRTAGSGIDALVKAPDKLAHLKAMGDRHWATLGESFPGAAGAAFLCVFLLAAFGYAAYRIAGRDKRHTLPSTLILGFAPVFFWWFYVSDMQMGRHLLVAVIPFFVGIGLAFAAETERVRWAIGAFCFTLMWTTYPQAWLAIGNDARAFFRGLERERHLNLQMETAQFLANVRRQPNSVILACGAEMMPELEYLMPGYGNFENCAGWRNPDPERKIVYIVRRLDSKADLGYTRIKSMCPETVYSHPTFAQYGYFIDRCPVGIAGFD